MALRSGYKGFKKLLPGLKITRPGTLGIDNDTLIPELNKTFFPRSEQIVLGVKNLLPPILTADKTVGTITYTVDSDGVITASGNTTEYAPIECALGSQTSNYLGLKSGDSFTLSGCPSGGTLETFALWLHVYYTDNTDENFLDYGNGVTVTIASSKTVKGVRWGFYINRGNAPSASIKPMLRLASDPDSTFAPYAMTNEELMENKWDKTMVIASGDLDDYKTAGMYYWSTTAPSHSPENLTFCKMIVFVGAGSIHQVVLRDNGYVAMRQYDGSEWKSWYKFTSTEITP